MADNRQQHHPHILRRGFPFPTPLSFRPRRAVFMPSKQRCLKNKGTKRNARVPVGARTGEAPAAAQVMRCLHPGETALQPRTTDMLKMLSSNGSARSGTVAEQTVQTGNCLPNLDIFPRVDYDFDMGALDFLLDTPAIPNQLNRSPLATTTTIDHFPSLPLSPLTPRPLFPAMASKTPGFSGFHISYQRLQYVLEALMNAPKQMAHENALPWCHPQLYRDATPRAMQDAQACSALYAARNRANAAAVRRIVEARVADLIATLPPLPPATDTTEPTPPPPPPPETATQIPTAAPSPLETLARAHALILYQVMQLFDGDPAARAAAENTMPYLDVMVKALAPIAAEDQPGPFLPEEAPRRWWWGWGWAAAAAAVSAGGHARVLGGVDCAGVGEADGVVDEGAVVVVSVVADGGTDLL
ncbi:hypothetical protein CHGG_03438 [Chaetomium globosum CBS 148.51]|uniref:Uncharacterized protein n=1 Tax=Chaetomium globosum (strain ATCC 6205 / CBS 148.51 / DSM 1962 / NBRC 6347 / NRRL 1970) TaxID=306901 RepID=Q2H8L6_CHAGB|nr:uncharacterized protein CHGG_03438 [Chaetomium globosum CBS 148.51]EAQ91503.1 hypothetical protein CHGG_03438 [Chaetomium globosum CBS 148.51]